MKRISIAGGAAQTTSIMFDNSVVAAQPSFVGAASFCSAGSVVSLGFWSLLGDIPVPIRLHAGVNPLNQVDVDLFWTGNEPQFALYRSVSPQDVLNPANLVLQTNACATTDSQVPLSDLVFYKVIPVSVPPD
jgi:hypothetical protein